MKNESEIHIYTASFGKNPSVLIKTTSTFALELLRKLENTAEKKDIIFIKDGFASLYISVARLTVKRHIR